jgi:hypothetical protein
MESSVALCWAELSAPVCALLDSGLQVGSKGGDKWLSQEPGKECFILTTEQRMQPWASVAAGSPSGPSSVLLAQLGARVKAGTALCPGKQQGAVVAAAGHSGWGRGRSVSLAS